MKLIKKARTSCKTAAHFVLKGALLSAVLSALLSAGCATARGTRLSLAKQGVFSSGGTVTAPVAGKYDETKNWLDLERSGNTAHVDHANVFYQIPAGSAASPVVYLHGYGQSRTGWMATPDGREGWSDIFLKKGRAAFLWISRGAGLRVLPSAWLRTRSMREVPKASCISLAIKRGTRTLESDASLRDVMRAVNFLREKKRKISFSAK